MLSRQSVCQKMESEVVAGERIVTEGVACEGVAGQALNRAGKEVGIKIGRSM